MADLGVARRRVPLEEIDGGDHETGSAEATLQAVLFRERALDRVQLTVLRQALDRDDRGAVRLDREHRACLRRATVDEDGAGSALACVAPDVRAGQGERLSQVLDEQKSGYDLAGVAGPVDGERDRMGHSAPPHNPAPYADERRDKLPRLERRRKASSPVVCRSTSRALA